jgi:hypothetical protein
MRGYSLLCSADSVFIMDDKNGTTDTIEWRNVRKDKNVLHAINKYLYFTDQTFERLLFQVQTCYAYNYESVVNEIIPYTFEGPWLRGYEPISASDATGDAKQSEELEDLNITDALIPTRKNNVTFNKMFSNVELLYQDCCLPPPSNISFGRYYLRAGPNTICFELHKVDVISLMRHEDNINQIFIKIDNETKEKIKINCKLFKQKELSKYKIDTPVACKHDVTGEKLGKLDTLFIKVKGFHSIYDNNRKISLEDVDRYMTDSAVKADLTIVPYIHSQGRQIHLQNRNNGGVQLKVTFKLSSMKVYLK